jgi:hypothetical protein
VQEVPPGPPDQVRRLERYRQEHPDVDIEPPGARSAVWRAFRDGDLIAYGFTLMVFLERLEDLPEPLGAAQDSGRRRCGKASFCPCQQFQGGRARRHGRQDCGLRPYLGTAAPRSVPCSGRAVRPDLADSTTISGGFCPQAALDLQAPESWPRFVQQPERCGAGRLSGVLDDRVPARCCARKSPGLCRGVRRNHVSIVNQGRAGTLCL